MENDDKNVRKACVYRGQGIVLSLLVFDQFDPKLIRYLRACSAANTALWLCVRTMATEEQQVIPVRMFLLLESMILICSIVLYSFPY